MKSSLNQYYATFLVSLDTNFPANICSNTTNNTNLEKKRHRFATQANDRISRGRRGGAWANENYNENK